MENKNIEQCFDSLIDYLNQVLQKLNEGQFLTEQMCSEMLRLVDEVHQAQKRCVQTLHEAGVENPVCSSIRDFKAQIEESRRKTAMEQIAKVRQVMEAFLSVYSTSGENATELGQFFDRINLSDENALLHIAESGELEQYQAFIKCVRDGTADLVAVTPLTEIFGYKLAFALMKGDLRLGDPS